jgi:hypothetical protein
MKTKNKVEIYWLDNPEEQDYPSAMSYLSLLFDTKHAEQFVDDLRKTSVTLFKAKDIFRASSLSLLGISNFHVKRDIAKIKKEHHLSPLLLVRDPQNRKLIIADGYHRLCAVYQFNEDADIPCKII